MLISQFRPIIFSRRSLAFYARKNLFFVRWDCLILGPPMRQVPVPTFHGLVDMLLGRLTPADDSFALRCSKKWVHYAGLGTAVCSSLRIAVPCHSGAPGGGII